MQIEAGIKSDREGLSVEHSLLIYLRGLGFWSTADKGYSIAKTALWLKAVQTEHAD
ncbi:MAG: hypothetical protein QNL14_07970 [Deltaproteobacteria bacterium]|nr:hypothetical protein [Deltaproteobacteria bacterium]